MKDQCYQATEFDRLLELPAGHRDLDHLSRCSNCRNDLALYKGFLAPADSNGGGGIMESHQRLMAFLEPDVDQKPEPIILPTRRFGNLGRVAMLAAAGLACAALLVNLDFLSSDRLPEGPSGVVRDLSETTFAWQLSEESTAGGFVLTWASHQQADSYVVVVMDSSLNQIDRIAVPSSGSFQLRDSEYLWLNNQPGPFFWSVKALSKGDEIAQSPVRSLERGP